MDGNRSERSAADEAAPRASFGRKAHALRLTVGCAILAVAVAMLAAPKPVQAGERGTTGSELRSQLDGARVAGAVLYLGAHPDDENTALLAYFARERHLRTAYLSLTRGDGGQNLVGSEQGDLLGVLRTQELLAARRIDGAEQFFTRATDFGYSKTAEETLGIWDRDGVLADIVWVIRSFRPDVVITRFPANGDGGHGHHTASAILAAEAFAAAADPARFPEQLALVKPWQAARLVWNSWRPPGAVVPSAAAAAVRSGGSPARPAGGPAIQAAGSGTLPAGRTAAQTVAAGFPSAVVTIDIGGFDPLLGRSAGEIAAEARTFHKSQGFGSAPRRGTLPQSFEAVAGVPAVSDLFDGIDVSWQRFAGGEQVDRKLEAVVRDFADRDPAASVPALAEVLGEIDRMSADPGVAAARARLEEVLVHCAGIIADAAAAAPTAAPGTTVKVTLGALNRSRLPVSLVRVVLATGATPVAAPVSLEPNQPFSLETSLALPAGAAVTRPYWLVGARQTGSLAVGPQALAGQPEGPPAATATFFLRIASREIALEVPVVHRTVDPVDGERIRPFLIVPALTAEVASDLVIFPDQAPRDVVVDFRADAGGARATVRAEVPVGWRVEPGRVEIDLPGSGGPRRVTFSVIPPAQPVSGELTLRLEADGAPVFRIARVEHAHVPVQLVPEPVRLDLVRADITVPVRRVGYVTGPGDEVPRVLRQLGLVVVELSDDDLATGDLAGFEAIVTGVRAYNTRARLADAQPRLLEYVRRGGTLVVQYNNNRELVTADLGPWPLKLSRERVTDETAAVTIRDAADAILVIPNRIGPEDFSGWVQERCSYVPESWDSRYRAPLAMADPGEKELGGALLVASVGAGTYVHTSLAFFRQLPAGVPGGLRLFCNLLGGGRLRD